MQDQSADVTWSPKDVPVSARFDDPYYSLDDGLAETRHVFLEGNRLPARFTPGFHIAELGFGTGLSFLTAWQAWREAKVAGPLTFTSFEAYPLTVPQIGRALAAFDGLGALREDLTRHWGAQGGALAIAPDVRLHVVVGDARVTLPAWNGAADAWFLDGFSPARNPELWSEPLMHAVGAHSRTGATLATYTAAGAVRRALDAAGFEVQRVAGFGRKRHMTVGVRRG